jgi:hypothetical protein
MEKTRNRRLWEGQLLPKRPPLEYLEGDALLEVLRDRWRALEMEQL